MVYSGITSGADRSHPKPRVMSTTLALIAALLLLPIIIILWATESTEQRAKRLRSYGWTQRRIAEHLGISRSRVQRIVTAHG